MDEDLQDYVDGLECGNTALDLEVEDLKADKIQLQTAKEVLEAENERLRNALAILTSMGHGEAVTQALRLASPNSDSDIHVQASVVTVHD